MRRESPRLRSNADLIRILMYSLSLSLSLPPRPRFSLSLMFLFPLSPTDSTLKHSPDNVARTPYAYKGGKCGRMNSILPALDGCVMPLIRDHSYLLE